jgi:VWFA-related protein
MRNAFPKTIFLTLLIAASLLTGRSLNAQQQSGCITGDEVKKMTAQIESGPPAAFNKKLARELQKMKDKYREAYRYAATVDFQDRGLNKDIGKVRDKNDARLCGILKEFGWPTASMVGLDGADAVFFLLKAASSLEFQSGLLPVLTAAVKKNELEKNGDFAAFIDLLQVRAGRKQLFGTQTVHRGDFLVLLPLQSERQVDSWRADYNMRPLADGLKNTELAHRTPVLRSWAGTAGSDPSPSPANTAPVSAQDPGKGANVDLQRDGADDKEGVIKVDTSLVSLPVFVYNPSGNPMDVLAPKDFEVYEDGNREDISFFSAADTPFDLVLLLDLSGSTEGKLQLIREATNRFIQAKRPADKLAIVAFADKITVVSPLSDDTGKLLESVKTMAEKGNSKVWDALKFTLDSVFEAKTPLRRRAVVFLTDGVDNSLYGDNRGSKISFADLFEAVKISETSIFPIYLDTEQQFRDSEEAYKRARSTLSLLSAETGGRFYKAKLIEDLNGVYNQVLNDLSRIYTIGYVPSNEKRDGAWRNVRVAVPARPELTVKTKTGYYAK